MRTLNIESADDIRSIFTNPEWRVRPPGNEVPAGLRGSLAGEILSRFARMSDGNDHLRRKQLVIDLINSLDMDAIPRHTEHILRRIGPANPHSLQFLVPGMVVSALLGVLEPRQQLLVEQVRALVIAVRPAASESHHARTINSIESAVPIIAEALDAADRDDLDVIASHISLIFQASDACAAMIGNALLLLSEMPDSAPGSAEEIVRASMHNRVPVRSTSRFRNGEAAVLDLEAAHMHQPAAEWTFGFGPHACPGRSVAVRIAVACINAVIARPPFDFSAVRRIGWENLPNVWIPILELETGPPR